MTLQKPVFPKDRWAIIPKNTALVVIDMQKVFMDDGLYGCPGAAALVPGVNALAALCRKVKIPVIFVKASRRADLSDSGLMVDFSLQTPDPQRHPFDGRKGAEFADGLDVQPNDYIVPKVRYSALVPGSSQLETLLRGMGKDSIIICGVATDVCVATTATTAMCLGFKVFFVGDLTATRTAERQKAALEVMNMHFAKVMTLAGVKKELAKLAK